MLLVKKRTTLLSKQVDMPVNGLPEFGVVFIMCMQKNTYGSVSKYKCAFLFHFI